MRERRACTRAERWLASRWIEAALAVFGTASLVAMAYSDNDSSWAVTAVIVTTLALIFGSRFIARRLRRRSRELARAHDGRLCLRCCHSLAGLGDDTLRCPECGHVQSGARARRHWQRLYDLDPLPANAEAIAKVATSSKPLSSRPHPHEADPLEATPPKKEPNKPPG